MITELNRLRSAAVNVRCFCSWGGVTVFAILVVVVGGVVAVVMLSTVVFLLSHCLPGAAII